MNTVILAIETSSRLGSVAIASGQQLLEETFFSGPMKHSVEIFPDICLLLQRFEKKPGHIEQVYISFGPGSFTGLRIAVTLAKMLCLANDAKIVPVNSLDVIAANVNGLISTSDLSQVANNVRPVTNVDRIATILDAKRNQFYTAAYERSTDAIWKKILPDSLMTAEEFLNKFADKDKPVCLLGDGLLYHKDKFKANGVFFFDEKFWSPRASKVHQLGWQLALQNKFTDPLSLTPNYLMRPDIKQKNP